MEEKQKTAGELRREALLYQPKNGYDRLSAQDEADMKSYCEDYKKFLDAGKTERECVTEAVRLAEAIHVNIAITLHFSSRHLSYKSVEHGAIRHIECAGVKDKRIATVSQLHLGTCHHHVVEGNILIEFLLEQKRRE